MTQLNEAIPVRAIQPDQFDGLQSVVAYLRAIPGNEIAPGVIAGEWRAYLFAAGGSAGGWKLHGPSFRTRLRRLELLAALAVLTTLPRNVRVELRSASPYVVEGINENLPRWKRRGWKQSTSREDSPPIEDADLWQTMDGLLARRDVKCTLCLDDVTHEIPNC